MHTMKMEQEMSMRFEEQLKASNRNMRNVDNQMMRLRKNGTLTTLRTTGPSPLKRRKIEKTEGDDNAMDFVKEETDRSDYSETDQEQNKNQDKEHGVEPKSEDDTKVNEDE